MHIPVLVTETVANLRLHHGARVIDANVGEGGHARAILSEIGLNGRLLGIDRDEEAVAAARLNLQSFGQQVLVVHATFDNLSALALAHDFADADAVLFDLGVSSRQLDTPGRGFSWRWEAPLDMRMDTSRGLTAAELLQALSVTELAKIFWEYGEERFADKIARAVVERRRLKPLTTTTELADLVCQAVPAKLQPRKIHPATKIFQALRIAANDELMQLEKTLPQAVAALKSGGRLAVITFHSLEDRVVKHFFRREARDCICAPSVPVCRCQHQARLKIITKKPIIPGSKEISNNPRSRSAKLRVAAKI